MDKEKNGHPGKNDSTPSRFLKFSGVAMQMLGTILIFTYGGYRLDEHQQNSVPVWTLILSLGSIGASLYLLIRSISKM
ncbi:AtpZ/AtpI family protein [Dyadobacter sp. 32]|uniref:AtpZ/AtpI family protein n=1 Tax=Dyadobacter sp. 32 TaxID=538966 RepID=UPI0011F087C1